MCLGTRSQPLFIYLYTFVLGTDHRHKWDLMFFSRTSAKGTGRRWTSRDGKTSPTLAYTEEAIYTEGLGRGKERRSGEKRARWKESKAKSRESVFACTHCNRDSHRLRCSAPPSAAKA